MRADFRSILRRDVLSLCAFIFVADCLSGLIAPTFSLYAQGLGASVVLIGALSSAVGLTSLISAVPVGILSDSFGRRRLLLLGMVVWGLSLLVMSVAPHPYVLFPGRVLMGLAAIMTFGLGAAFLGDITEGRERGPAFGLYATAMGLGFAVGPLVGGLISDWYSIEVSYMVGAGLAAAGFLFGLWTLPTVRRTSVAKSNRPARALTSSLNQLRVVLGDVLIVLACVGVMLQTVAFAGALQNFFPLYASAALIGPATIAPMFSVRAFTSTVFRMPMGLLSSYISPAGVMILSLLTIGVTLLGISQTTNPMMLTILLAVEGIGFGGFVTAGQAFIAEHSDSDTRGTAMGVYKMAGAIGATAGPLALGIIASEWGLSAVFIVTGMTVMLGVILMVAILYRAPSTSEPKQSVRTAPTPSSEN
jgi:MFS transporter, DHA1 family, multidrug resistance protein